MLEFNLTHSSRKNTASPARLFTKLSNAQQHYLHISCNESHPNRTINVESAQVNRGYNCADSHETLSHRINGEILYRILWKWNKNVENIKKKLMPLCQSVVFGAVIFIKIVNALQSCNGIYTYNLTQIDRERRELREEIHLRP